MQNTARSFSWVSHWVEQFTEPAAPLNEVRKLNGSRDRNRDAYDQASRWMIDYALCSEQMNVNV